MALLKLSGERSFVAVHAAAELLGNVHIINLDAETMTGRETETFLLDFVVGDSDGEVIYRLLVLKSVDNLVHLKVAQMSLLMQKYRIQVRRAKGLSLKLVFCITKKNGRGTTRAKHSRGCIGGADRYVRGQRHGKIAAAQEITGDIQTGIGN